MGAPLGSANKIYLKVIISVNEIISFTPKKFFLH